MLSGSFQHQLLRTALEGHLRQGVAAIGFTDTTVPLPKAVCSTWSP